jgi:WD40 repeat protein
MSLEKIWKAPDVAVKRVLEGFGKVTLKDALVNRIALAKIYAARGKLSELETSFVEYKNFEKIMLSNTFSTAMRKLDTAVSTALIIDEMGLGDIMNQFQEDNTQTLIASAGHDNKIIIQEIESKEILKILRPSSGIEGITSIIELKDLPNEWKGKRILVDSTTGGSIHIWDVTSGKPLDTLDNEYPVRKVIQLFGIPKSYQGGGVLIASADEVGFINVWKILNGSGELVRRIKTDAGYETILQLSDNTVITTSGNIIKRWDIFTGQLIKNIEVNNVRENINIIETPSSNSDKYVIFTMHTSYIEYLCSLNLNTGKSTEIDLRYKVLCAVEGNVEGNIMAANEDKATLLTAGEDGLVAIGPEFVFEWVNDSYITSLVQVGPKTFVIGLFNGTLATFELEEPRQGDVRRKVSPKVINSHAGKVTSMVAFDS